MKREDGYYWVRMGTFWRIAFWDGKDWALICNLRPYRDRDFNEIDEERVLRGK